MKLLVKISGNGAKGPIISAVIPVSLLPSRGLEESDVPMWDTLMSNPVDSFYQDCLQMA